MTPGGHPLTGESMKRIWIGLLACALCLFAAAAASRILCLALRNASTNGTQAGQV